MTKRCLSTLIALSTLITFGCSEVDGLNNPTQVACTHGTTQCMDTILQTCINGFWDAVEDCGEEGCNAETGKCNKSTPKCTEGTKQCEGSIPQTCSNGDWVNGTDCGEAGCNPETGICNEPKCTDGTKQCLGTMPQLCFNGAWMNGTDCGEVGCNPETGKCNVESTPCTNGTKQCLGTMPQLCFNGAWMNGTDCGEVGCNPETGKCNVESTTPCTNGTKQCLGTMPQLCFNGAWMNGTDCGTAGCNEATGMCNANEPNPDTTCEKETYIPSCSADKLNGYYCGSQGKVVTVSCPDANCVNNNGYIKCDVSNSGNSGTGEACEKASYTPSCSADRLNGYYCGNKGTVVTVSCPNANCVNNNGYIKCDDVGSTTAPCAPGGTEYCQKTCNAARTEGYYFSGGKVNTVSCPNADCNISADNKVVCGNSSTDEACEKASYTPSCSADKTKGYYCGSQGKVVTLSCPNANCVNNNGYIKCDDSNNEPLTNCSTTEGASCTKCQSVCEGLNGYYCDTTAGVIRKKTCASSCAVVSTSVKCDGTCNGTTVTTGGKVGDCCDQNVYKPTGCDTGLRCNSSGVVTKWSCYNGQTCSYNPNDSTYPGGTFSCN